MSPWRQEISSEFGEEIKFPYRDIKKYKVKISCVCQCVYAEVFLTSENFSREKISEKSTHGL